MTIVRMLTLGMAVALVSSASAQDKKQAKLDPAKLIGEYTFVSGAKDGKPTPADGFKGVVFIVTKDNMTLKTPDGDFKFGYKIDASKTPAHIDLEILDGPIGKGAKTPGIIALDGTTVKLAYHGMGGDRPKDFDAKAGTGCHTYTLKKAAAKKDK